MALTDSNKEKHLKRGKRKVDAVTNLRWGDEQKLNAVKSWLVLGDLRMVGRILNIPEVTLRVWKASTWWKDVVDEIRAQETIELSSKMKSIANAAHSVVANRLETGDAVLTSKGEIVFKPVSMRDAHRVAVDMVNQRKVLEKATSFDDPQEQNTDRLEALAEKFATFATMSIEKKLDQKRTVDVPLVEDVTPKEQ